MTGNTSDSLHDDVGLSSKLELSPQVSRAGEESSK